MAYKYMVVWFNPAKCWVGGTYQHKGKRIKFRRPLESNVRPFRSLNKAMKFQREWSKPYPHIYELKE